MKRAGLRLLDLVDCWRGYHSWPMTIQGPQGVVVDAGPCDVCGVPYPLPIGSRLRGSWP